MKKDASILMSSSLKINPQGNVAKYLCYREAWTRIKEAQKQGFYMEAVTLEESIITDRLISYLVDIEAIQRAGKLNNYPHFAILIKKWQQQHPDPIEFKEYSDLKTAVDNWREQRNKIVHGMVKSHVNEANNDILDFLEEAKQTAQEGELLARAVSQWFKNLRKIYVANSSQ